MSLPRYLLRCAPSLRHFCTSTNAANHEFLQPSNYLNSWKSPKDPKEAEKKLALLRREYAKKVKTVRKEYIREMEAQRLAKLKKDEERKEVLRIANEERKAAKAAEKKAKALERQIAEQEFRQTLMKERAEKLEYWRMRMNQVEEKKKEKRELLHRKSSLWVDEADLAKAVFMAVVDRQPL